MTRKKGRGATPVGDDIVAFYRENPNEWLTIEDVVAKFGCASTTARAALGQLTTTGQLVRVSIYRTPEVACS
jgi:predicted transcriptional regulator of viral defense system